MRPTNLGFRSPKERTGGFAWPTVTFDGRSLQYMNAPMSQTIGKSRRFSQYDSNARRTSSLVGPGSYNLQRDPIKQWNIAGTPVIKPYMAIKDPLVNGYYFIGNQVVYDSNFPRTSKGKQKSMNLFDYKPVRTSNIQTSKNSKSQHIEDSKETVEASKE